MASANSSTVQILVDFRAGARLADVKISGTEKMLGFSLQGDKCECKLMVDAGAGIGMAIETCIKVEPADGGGMVVKVELLPAVPNVEQPQDEIAESNEMGGAAKFKVKMD